MNEKPIRIKKKRGLKGEDGHKTFSVRVRDDVVAKLDEISVKTNRTRNDLINIFLEYGVENWELEAEVCK